MALSADASALSRMHDPQYMPAAPAVTLAILMSSSYPCRPESPQHLVEDRPQQQRAADDRVLESRRNTEHRRQVWQDNQDARTNRQAGDGTLAAAQTAPPEDGAGDRV